MAQLTQKELMLLQDNIRMCQETGNSCRLCQYGRDPQLKTFASR